MKKRDKQLERFGRVVEDLVMLYLMFACVWSICHIVGEIFAKLGVG